MDYFQMKSLAIIACIFLIVALVQSQDSGWEFLKFLTENMPPLLP